MTIDIFHNIVWSKYKGVVFSSLHQLAESRGRQVRFTQIAETDGDRVGLSSVDVSYHRYPFSLLFEGAYSSVSKWRLMKVLFVRVWRSDADLVLIPCYDKPEYWAMLLAALIRRKRCGVFVDSTSYDRPQKAWKGWLKRTFLRRCQIVFVYGSRAREYAISCGASPSVIFQRCQAAALPHGYEARKVAERRLALAPPPTAPRFLYVGRLAPEKSLQTLIRAFSEVRRKLDGASLRLVGAGPLKADLELLVAELGVSDYVFFVGGLDADALAYEYLSATCLVLPSVSEPWGLVANEALSYGCPLIVSDRCGCVPELVQEGATGFSFSAGSVGELAEVLEKVPSHFDDVRRTTAICLELISAYSPEHAACQILDGCSAVLGMAEAGGG